MRMIGSGIVLLLPLLSQVTFRIQYLEFSSQKEVALNSATNYAIKNYLPSQSVAQSTFFFRGYQAFYTMQQNSSSSLLFSLFMQTGPAISSGYNIGLKYDGGSAFNETL